jgi:integration host factor subunit beta
MSGEVATKSLPQKLTKNGIIDAVYLNSGFNRTDIRPIFEMIFGEIKDGLVAGRTIELRGVGTFEVKIRNARKKARNPRTGGLVPAHRHRVVTFRPGQELKCAVWKVPETDTPFDAPLEAEADADASADTSVANGNPE